MTRTNGLIFGVTGTLGQALMREGEARGLVLIGAARRDCATRCDFRDLNALDELWRETEPDFVINAAALTDLGACERNPGLAYAINAHGPANLARLAHRYSTRLIQISTDQVYAPCGRGLHDEDAPTLPVNTYGASKLAGEHLALSAPDCLVIRTNLTGFRGWQTRPTFIEWCIRTIEQDDPVTLFTDYVTSTIDTTALAAAIFDLVEARAFGILNVASREAVSKAYFIDALCRCFGKTLSDAARDRVAGLRPERLLQAGLDVTRAEALLGTKLPTLAQVTQALHAEHQHRTQEAASWTTIPRSA